jgi:hypothetical protein
MKTLITVLVGFDEGIDMLPELLDGREGCPVQGPCFENGEPDLHLVEPRRRASA